MNSPRRAPQATRASTVNTELPFKNTDDEKIKGKEEVLLKRRRVVTPGGSLETNGELFTSSSSLL